MNMSGTTTIPDQAFALRELRASMNRVTQMAETRPAARVIAVTSGKGGVGKTNLAANLSVQFSRMGRKVLLVDADTGLGNLGVLMRLKPRYNVYHLLQGEQSLSDILVPGPAGISVLTASSGVSELANLDDRQKVILISELETVADQFDTMVIDTASGVGTNVLYFTGAATDVVLVATPEPTSLADAYALIKSLALRNRIQRVRLVVNQVKNKAEAVAVHHRLANAASAFLNVSVEFEGHIVVDPEVRQAVQQQRLFIEAAPKSKASQCLVKIAERLILHHHQTSRPIGNALFFWRRLLQEQSWGGV